MLVVKTEQIRRCEELEKLGRQIAATWNALLTFFYQLRFKNREFCFGTRFGCVKQTTFVSVFTAINWVNPAWPVEPILLTSTLLMGGPGDPGKDC